ncbi:MAG: peptidylprolyl isomerase [Firmicutes bacterium]|nr:peptidylprolyl isomerase [Bacillota bacterium]
MSSTPSAQSGHNGKSTQKNAAPKVMRWNGPPAMTLNPNDQYQATVHTTAGNFVIQLFAKQQPVAVNNFVFLANQGFYNNNQFFRVIQNFVIQTGDPLNNGTGGPGYTWNAELPVPFPYQPGIVAMAVSSAGPNTNGSQFFICTGPQSEQLNQQPQYTELGRVIKGWTTVLKIARGQVTVNPLTNEDSEPLHPYSITSITIQASPTSQTTS